MARHYVKNRTPTSPTELAQALADPDRAAELFGGSPASWTAFEAEYAKASPMVAQLAAEQAQLELQQALQQGGRQVPRGLTGPVATGKGRFYNKRAPGVRTEGIMPESDYPMADFFRMANGRNESFGPLRHSIHNAMSERVGSEGGFLVPEVLRSQILQMSLEHSVVRPRARIVPMDSLRVPYPSIDDTSHTSNVYGGVTGYWTEEGAAITQSAPAFSRVVLEAKKLAFFTNIPNELLADSGPAIEEWLQTQIPAALGWFEDLAFIGSATTGTGVGEPEGILNSPALIKVAAASANKITLTDVISVYTRLLPQCLMNENSLVWLCSPDVKAQLLQLAAEVTISATTSAISPPVWLAGMQAIDATPSTLFGHPLVVSEKLPSGASTNTTTAGALTLADFSFYLLGDRSELAVAMSEQYQFANDLTSYRILERCDGRSWIRSALSPFNGGVTLSPFVALDSTS